MRNKRANIFFEGTTVLVVLAFFAIASLVTAVVLSEFNTKWQTTGADADSKAAVSSLSSNTPQILDGGFAIILGGLWIAALVAAMYINTNPAFFFTTAFLLGILIFVVVIVGTAIDSIAETSVFATTYAQMPMMNWVFNHAWQTILMIALTLSIVLFGKRQVSPYEYA